MQPVFILVNSEPGKAWKIADSGKKIKNVKMAYAVTGIFDILIYAELGHMKELQDLIAELHTIDSVFSTRTETAIPSRIENID